MIIGRLPNPSIAHTKRGVPDNGIQQYIPKLHQLSDAVWEVWKAVTDQPQTLRFWARDGIRNGITIPLLDYLFKRDRNSLEVPWDRRLTFGLDRKGVACHTAWDRGGMVTHTAS